MLITTKYGNRANSNSGCIRVQCGDVRKSYPYDQSRNALWNHRHAAMTFARDKLKMALGEQFLETQTKDGLGYMRRCTSEVISVGSYL